MPWTPPASFIPGVLDMDSFFHQRNHEGLRAPSADMMFKILRDMERMNEQKKLNPPTGQESPSEENPSQETASEELIALPGWFNHQQNNDIWGQTGRPIPCKIFLYNENGAPIGQFGDAAHNSAFRFRPSTMTTFTNFSLDVRQNFNGDGKIVIPKTARGISKTGRDLHHFPENYLEDNLEFDLDNFSHLQVSLIETATDIPKKVPADAIADFTAPGGLCGFLQCVLKPKMQPVRTYGQEDTFEPGSEAAKFFDLVRSASRFRIFVRIARKNNKIDDEEVFKIFKLLVNRVRHSSRDRVPRTDWFYGHDPHYDPASSSPFSYYIDGGAAPFPVHPWLTVRRAQLYTRPPPLTGVPRKTFPSIKFYTSHFIPALLQERVESRRQLIATYNNRYYPAKFVTLEERHCFIHVRVTGDSAQMGGVKVMPQNGMKCSIIVRGFYNPASPDTLIKGHVSEQVEPLYDFTVDAQLPFGILHAGLDIDRKDLHMISLTISPVDLDIEQKLACISPLGDVTFSDRLLTQPAPQAGHRRIANFHLQNIIGEQELTTYSPNFVQELLGRLHFMSDVDAGTLQKEASAVANAIESELNEKQKDFLNVIHSGVISNLALLEGLPGTGKTHTLSGGIAFCIASRKKVLAVAQSHAAVNVLFRKVCDTIKKQLPPAAARDLLAKCTSIARGMDESAIAECLASNVHIPGMEDFSLAARMREYIEKHPTSQTVIEYIQHTSRRPQDRPTPHHSQHSFRSVLSKLQQEVLNTMMFVACTTFTAGTLRDLFQADVLIIDEASQIGEPDALVVLQAQSYLQLVVMAGDINQLGPVVMSEQGSSNTYGYVLKESMMKRVKLGYPHIARVRLNVSYRGHSSTIAMASEIFYNGDLEAAEGLDWDTALSRQVTTLLSGPRFSKAFNRAHVLNDSRQFFFDVVGQPTRGPSGSSSTNTKGVNAVITFVKLLLTDGGVQAADIGIISMYKHDFLEIKSRLKELGLAAVPEVATVDAFQGREKKIMIVHFVAAFAGSSNPFGLVANPNRLCVALTRSHEFQFLFGNLTLWESRLKDPKTAGQFKAIDEMVQHVRGHGQVVQWKDVAV